MRRTPFAKIENSLEFVVERPISVIFRRSVQPAEIGKRLKRELTSGELVTVRGRVAPNEFVVSLNPADAEPYLAHGRSIGQDMADWLEDVAQSMNLVTLGAMSVTFRPDPSVRRGRFEVISAVSDAEPEPAPYVDPGMTEAFEVAGKSAIVPAGFLEICSGPETGAVFPIRKRLITVGRDLSNDLVIESPQVSRFHAELQLFDDTLAVGDRASLNGTFVNGYPVAGWQSISPGDQIMFGTTICRYWRDTR